MAQRLLRFSAMRLMAGLGLLSASSGACVVPIPAEVEDQDAGTNSPPAILHPVPEMPFGNTAGPLVTEDFPAVTFDVKDPDVDDPIVVRVFANYQLGGLNLRYVDQKTVPGGEAIRPVELSTLGWCVGIEGTTNVVFDIVVSDRAFDLDPTAEPINRATTGETAIRSWVMDCL